MKTNIIFSLLSLFVITVFAEILGLGWPFGFISGFAIIFINNLAWGMCVFWSAIFFGAKEAIGRSTQNDEKMEKWIKKLSWVTIVIPLLVFLACSALSIFELIKPKLVMFSFSLLFISILIVLLAYKKNMLPIILSHNDYPLH